MNWEKSKSLTPLKLDFLVSFFKKCRDFFLTGGSALSVFYFDHRFSYDLDFFTTKDIDWHYLERLFSAVTTEINAEFTSITKAPFFHRYELKRNDDKEIIDFVIDKVPQIDKEKNKFDIIIVDTPLEIGINKICTLLSRTELKDLIDLYVLVKNGFDIKENIGKAKQKDGGVEPAMISYLLAQFKISKLPDYMIAKVSAAELEKFISDLKTLLADISFPAMQR
ncbi:MAG: nucleotidyl transferase AbiEii/AbiGii toxin family protein [Candidatus Aminicenantes bacterium]|nr:nucleotidyl transferase AbiEii/AbiGii toxin family protein [Candidatus Aminicenantes bacterium]